MNINLMNALIGGSTIIDFDISLANAVNAQSQLPIESYVVGNDEVVHPSVLYFKNGWNGYKYWMAYTPTPGGDAAYENPSICVSNDGATPITPPGLTNPIVLTPPTGYNADPCLYMSYDNTTMYCAYKSEYSGYNIKVISTTDGITWGNIKTLFSEATRYALSITVIKENGKYVMFAVDSKTSPYQLTKYESSSPDTGWSKIGYVGIPTSDTWHIEVRKIGKIYYIIYSTLTQLFITKSLDMQTYETPVKLLRRDIWASSMYKGSFILNTDNTGFDFYYGVRSPLWLVGRTNIDFNGKKFLENLNNEIATASVAKGNVVWDSFNRADNANLGNAESGQAWAKIGGGFKIVSNRITATAAGLNKSYINVGIPDFRFKINWTFYADESWILFRFVDNNNSWRFGINSLQKVVDGAITIVISNGWEYMVNDVVEIVCNGDNIKIYQNDVLVCNVTDAFNNTATRVGMQSNVTTCIYDSLLVSSI
jgi:hypothetical protein